MGYSEEIIKKVLNDYELLRTRAENKRDKYVKELYIKYPRLEEINNEINRLGFENTKKIMQNPLQSKYFNEEFKEKLEKLKSEEKEILEEKNIPLDYQKPVYECKICSDTGYVGNKKCNCFKEKLIKQAYSRSNLSNMLNEHGFENFSLKYYSDEKKGEGIQSDRENMRGIYMSCKKFCDEFTGVRKNLLMLGKPGLGKTFMSDCIAKEILNKGYTVVYVRATSLFRDYEEYKFGRKEDFDMDRLYNCDLLIIDDLGTENISKYGVSFLFDLINERIDRNKKMIINTNFSMNEISKTYSSRITSRIYEFFSILHFKGEDIRVKKLRNGEI